ncbi:unnamed protein product [Somion occarium]|uniref:Uncharacterized protein n=1 Tax=Somion occarium TaxID=3059160 RepID=A0ABP1DRN2_9APHY
MARSSVSSDDEAPEAISFNSEKKAAKGRDAALQQFQSEERLKTKEKNRRKDQALKERALSKRKPDVKGKDKAVNEEEDENEDDGSLAGPSRDDLEARMERAMRDAAEQSGSDLEDEEPEEFEGFNADDSEADEFSEASDDSVSDESSEDELPVHVREDGEEEESPSEEEDVPPRKPSQKLDYLPDHLFTAAFSQPETSSGAKRKAAASQKDTPTKKRRRLKKTNKDIVIGCVVNLLMFLLCTDRNTLCSSRTIRTVPKSSDSLVSTPVSKELRTSAGVNKFVKKSLNVQGKSQIAKTKGWDRRPGKSISSTIDYMF